jgi:hypothetical protein
MSPHLSLMVQFAAASLQGQLAGAGNTRPPGGRLYERAWLDAQKMFDALPDREKKALKASQFAHAREVNRNLPDNG